MLEPPVDLDVHVVDPPAEDAHEHHDVRFLVVAPAGSEPVGNQESEALRWVHRDEMEALGVDGGLLRLADRALECLERLEAEEGA